MADKSDSVKSWSWEAKKVLVLGQDGENYATASNPLPVSVDGLTFSGDLNVNAFKTYVGTADDAVLYVDGQDVSGTIPQWQGVGGYDATNVEFRPIHLLKRTTGTESPADTDDALVVYDVGGGATTLPATHRNPQDFSVAYTSSTTITVSSASFTVDDSNCFISYVMYRPSGGDWQSPIVNGVNGASITSSSDVITVSGAGTPFASGDDYLVGIIYQEKGYSTSSESKRVEEIDPLSEHYVSETLADVTNGTDGTYYYYVDMNGFRMLGLQLDLNGGSGTVTVTIEGSKQDDGTAAASCTYLDVTNDVFGSASFTADAMLDDDGEVLGMYKYVRVKVVANTSGSDDADWWIGAKRLY